MKISIGFSPCPNDTFIFDALIHHKIDTEGLEWEVVMADVEELNRRAFANDLMVTKLSYHAFAHLLPYYVLLDSGSALGNNCGPLLIAKQLISPNSQHSVAIPGKYTTANFLLSIAYPELTQKKNVLFSDIENAVLENKTDFGLLIHENRFTYEARGLVKIADLGEWWETYTQLPIPLGGIVVKRDINKAIQLKIERVLRRSIEFAFKHRDEPLLFMQQHAQTMSEDVMWQHVNLYVNEYSISLGTAGKAAISRLFQEAIHQKIILQQDIPIFL